MSISKELFLAILSMDAYNQGYDRGFEHGSMKIGPAERGSDEKLPAGAQSASFYALASEVGSGVDGLGAGSKAIAYRGTDTPPLALY